MTLRHRSKPSSNSLAELVAAMADAVILVDDAQRIVMLNAAAERMFAYDEGAARGDPVDTLIAGGITRRRTGVLVLLSGRRRDGVLLPLEAAISVLPPWSEHRMLVLRDVSVLRRVEAAFRASDERFRVAFETATIGFALTELDGRMRAVNQSLCDMLGYSEAELTSMTFEQITHPDDLVADVALARRLIAGEISRYRMEKRYVHKRGNAVWVLLVVSLVRDVAGQPLYFVAQGTDITMLKEAERALREHAAELERSNAELEELAYAASHDLQAPLRTVMSYAELLRERYDAVLDERGDRWLGYVVGGVSRMKRLVDGLLTLARVRTDGRVFSQTETAPIVARTWKRLRSQHAAGEARCTWSNLPSIVADGAQLEHLFQNLIGNALKYRRLDKPLEVEVSAERRTSGEDGEWVFTVRDNGIGFEMSQADRIFEMFHRLHRDDEYEGTGIGLAICRKIIDRHGGRIWAEASPGEGAAFHFTLSHRGP